MLPVRQLWPCRSAFAALLLLCLLTAGCDEPATTATSRPATAPAKVPEFGPTFIGLVIDQDGKPIPQAKISVRAMRLLDRQMGAGSASYPVDRRNAVEWDVYSDTKGLFGVGLRGDQQVLEIVDVAKPGFTWVYDLLADRGFPGPDSQSNRFYKLDGPHPFFNAWLPQYGEARVASDVKNPATYPMLADGSDVRIKEASRGGADRRSSGEIVVNKPVGILLPSAGPGSPPASEGWKGIGDAIHNFPLEKIKQWEKENNIKPDP